MRNLTIAMVLCALNGSVFAADFSRPFVEDDGKPVCSVPLCSGLPDTPNRPVCRKDAEECPTNKIFTLRVAARNALYASFPDEQNLSGDEKFKRAELAQSLVGANEVDLKAEDTALLKRLIAKLYGPLFVYQAWRELDPPTKSRAQKSN